MEYDAIEALRERHPAWRLLRAGNASLVLSFLGRFFVAGNRGATAAAEVIAALDDELYSLHAALAGDPDEPRFPKPPRAYLEDWSSTEIGYLRRFYPPGDDEVHYEVTPAFEKALRLGGGPAGAGVRRHRVAAAHRGRAAPPDRARLGDRPRDPAGRSCGASAPSWTPRSLPSRPAS